jgi:spore coat protein H
MASRARLFGLVSFQVILILARSVLNCQVPQNENEMLNLADQGFKIENTISLDISSSAYEKIKAVTGNKTGVKARLIVINGDTLVPEEIVTRGQTTLNYRRKSYSIDLQSEASLHHGDKTKTFRKFYVLSLSMDRNYATNRLAFEMMETAGIFHLFYAYGELRINGQSEGICMVIERPEDWAIKKMGSPVLIRRGYNNSIDKLKSDKGVDKETIKKYRTSFNQIYQSLNKHRGEELYKVISNLLETNDYMKWLAFNFYIRNGDYTDEVYFYVDPDSKKLSIIPWDYDDIFSTVPHEGYEESRRITGNNLFFSTEDELDKKIVSDPYLYKMYLVQFGELMNELTNGVLKSIFERTFAELFPYYADDEIISLSRFDRYKDLNLDGLKNNMQTLFNQVLISRSTYIKLISDQHN